MENKIPISQSSEHESHKISEEAARPAAYARILARIRKMQVEQLEWQGP